MSWENPIDEVNAAGSAVPNAGMEPPPTANLEPLRDVPAETLTHWPTHSWFNKLQPSNLSIADPGEESNKFSRRFQSLVDRALAPALVSTIGVIAVTFVGLWLHPSPGGAISRVSYSLVEEPPLSKSVRVEDPFLPPPKKFDLPPPPAFTDRKKNESAPESAPAPKTLSPPTRAAPPAELIPPSPSIQKKEPATAPKEKPAETPRTNPPPENLPRSWPAPPVATVPVRREPAPIAVSKRPCTPAMPRESVSRNFDVHAPPVRLDPELRASAVRIRRLEIVESSPPVQPARHLTPIPEPAVALNAKPALPSVVEKRPSPTARPDRIELREVPRIRRVGAPTLLVARAIDALGRPMPNAMIEWSVDRRGVGHVVTIPELFRQDRDESPADSSWASAVPEKVLPTFAKTLTSARAFRLDAAGADGAPLEIQVGEACCYVNSASAGDMAVSAIAPAILGAERREAVARIHWTSARVEFPKNLRAPTGSEIVLATQVTDAGDGRPLPGYIVRHQVQGTEGVVRDSVEEVVTDSQGKAVFRRSRALRQPGTETVEMRLFSGNYLPGSEAVELARGECRLEWFDPKIALRIECESLAPAAQWFPIDLRIANGDSGIHHSLKLSVDQSAGVELASDAEGNPLGSRLDVRPLKPGDSESFRLFVRSRTPGKHPIRCSIADAHGVRAEQEIRLEFAVPKLKIEKAPSIRLAVGQKHEHRIVVRNEARVPAFRIEVEDDLPPEVLAEVVDGLRMMDRQRWSLESLKPGESRTLRANWTARKPVDPVALRARASAEYAPAVEAFSSFGVRGFPSLSVEIIEAADPVEVGKPIQLTIRIRNRGSAAAENVALTGVLSDRTAFVSASGALGAASVDGRIRFDNLSRIDPNETVEAVLLLRAARPGEARTSIRLFHEAVGPDGLETQESTHLFDASRLTAK